MYTKKTEVARTSLHVIVSYGDGIAYEIKRLSDNRRVFLQGKDANNLKNYLDSVKHSFPEAYHTAVEFIVGEIFTYRKPAEDN